MNVIRGVIPRGIASVLAAIVAAATGLACNRAINKQTVQGANGSRESTDLSSLPTDAQLTNEFLPYCRLVLVATEHGCRYRLAQQDRADGGVVIADANRTAGCGERVETCTGRFNASIHKTRPLSGSLAINSADYSPSLIRLNPAEITIVMARPEAFCTDPADVNSLAKALFHEALHFCPLFGGPNPGDRIWPFTPAESILNECSK